MKSNTLYTEPPVGMVTNLAAFPGLNTVTLTWAAVQGATSYVIGLQAVGDDTWTTVSDSKNFSSIWCVNLRF